MLEMNGNLWDYYGKPKTVVLITTNGFVKNDGEAVMGSGCAAEAARRFQWLPKSLGDSLITHGNVPTWFLADRLATFPVKHNWYEKADFDLIRKSVLWLFHTASESSLRHYNFVLPRPGCGNGQLAWPDVKPLLLGLPDNVFVIDFAWRKPPLPVTDYKKSEGGQ
jgi:hypothetical protein